MLDVSRQRVAMLVRQGKLPYVRLGARVVFPVGAIEARATSPKPTRWSPPPQGWLTVGQFAERMDVTPETVRSWIRRGLLDSTERSGALMISEDQVESFVRPKRGRPTPPE